MAKPLMVIVEPDESYLMPLEVKLAEALEEMADIEIISDMEYFADYFLLPREIDILIIDEAVYSQQLGMHNIDRICVLTESAPNGSGNERYEDVLQGVSYIYRFMSLHMIVDKVVRAVENRIRPGERELQKDKRKTKIAAVISPQGGAGATTIAVGISAVLHQMFKKVLFVSFQMYQSFHYYLTNKSVLPMEACLRLRTDNRQVYEDMKPCLIKEGAHYLPPVKASRESFGIEISAYINLVSRVCLTNDYDYIIVDIGNELTAATAAFLEDAQKVYVVVRQDPFSAYKTTVFRRSIDCSDKEKYFFVCNCYEKEKENELLKQTEEEACAVQCCYVERQKNIEVMRAEDLAAEEGIRRLGMMLA